MTTSIAKNFLIAFAVFLLLPLSVNAGSLYFEPDSVTLAPGEQVYIDIMVNTQGKEINALEFTVTFKAEDIEILEVRDGRSVIDFWITRGHYNNVLEVAGVITGGIGREGSGPYKIATVVLKGMTEAEGMTWIRNQRVLANDGLGTTLVSSGGSFSYTVKNGGATVEGEDASRIDEALGDTEPPDDFEIILSRDAKLFDGKYFIVFRTQDSGSGVAYFEVKEGEGEWVRV
jgi:hypothetical protein